jgi:hypothetical protein
MPGDFAPQEESAGTQYVIRQSRSRACDPREGTRGSGIIRFREESDWPLKWNA